MQSASRRAKQHAHRFPPGRIFGIFRYAGEVISGFRNCRLKCSRSIIHAVTSVGEAGAVWIYVRERRHDPCGIRPAHAPFGWDQCYLSDFIANARVRELLRLDKGFPYRWVL
jgi:hypothetical protein